MFDVVILLVYSYVQRGYCSIFGISPSTGNILWNECAHDAPASTTLNYITFMKVALHIHPARTEEIRFRFFFKSCVLLHFLSTYFSRCSQLHLRDERDKMWEEVKI